jgi:hypothetical protein
MCLCSTPYIVTVVMTDYCTGSFCERNVHQPTACPAGKFTASSGASACVTCPSGLASRDAIGTVQMCEIIIEST